MRRRRLIGRRSFRVDAFFILDKKVLNIHTPSAPTPNTIVGASSNFKESTNDHYQVDKH